MIRLVTLPKKELMLLAAKMVVSGEFSSVVPEGLSRRFSFFHFDSAVGRQGHDVPL
jgi:hypothetical protein